MRLEAFAGSKNTLVALFVLLFLVPAAKADWIKERPSSGHYGETKTKAKIVTPDASATHFQIRINPIAGSFGHVSGDMTMNATPSITIGLTGDIAKSREEVERRPSGERVLSPGADMHALGIIGNYFFSGNAFSDSFFVGPRVKYVAGEQGTANGLFSGESDFEAIGAELFFGYQMHWSNFNLAVSAGHSLYRLLRTNSKNQFVDSFPFKGSDASHSDPNQKKKITMIEGEVRFGWTF